ncbi:hypothetical protein [Acuticoccus mangrovi]|uniref:Uncharacterized protein n=1 Tax=Acuticoccus mangrovi TaxID=2796142 RepID=A0A934IKZ9_9HYPH|nr:hypothetical protein [Acuticoccus mangrovi]MBJ3774276.1 hypothetical protein [Acuticoccus mangrovi]
MRINVGARPSMGRLTTATVKGAALRWSLARLCGALMVLGLAMPALAFDASDCDSERRLDNDELAARLRQSADASDKAKQCRVRIAALRMGLLAPEDFGADDFSPYYKMLTRDFAVTPEDPYPAYFLRRLADAVVAAEPARTTDPVFHASLLAAFQSQTTGPDGLADATAGFRGPADAGAGETGPAPLVDVPTAPVASIAGSLADDGPAAPQVPARAAPPAVPSGVAAPGAPSPASGAGDPVVFGALAPDAHRPRNTPPPHPLADTRKEAAAARARLFADGNCLEPAQVRDADVQRNRRAIERARLCVTREGVREGAIDWAFTSIENPAHPDGPVWYLPHDDEAEAFDAAVYAITRYGGRMVAVAGPETRYYRLYDPNRYFAADDADARPCKIRRGTPHYTAYVMNLFKGRPQILSMHNNTRGGAVTVNVWDAKNRGYKAGGRRPISDADHLVYIASAKPIDSDPEALARRDLVVAAGMNVVHETVTARNNDCSFSNYVVLRDGRPYFNIEAVHGSSLQKDMVDRLLGALGYRPVAGG